MYTQGCHKLAQFFAKIRKIHYSLRIASRLETPVLTQIWTIFLQFWNRSRSGPIWTRFGQIWIEKKWVKLESQLE